MRKTFGISIAAILALLIAGCGDDSSSDSSGNEPDAATGDETESEDTETADDTETDPETTSDDSEAGTPTETDTETDSGVSEPVDADTPTETDDSDASSPDDGPVEAGPPPEEDASTEPTDGGSPTEEPSEAGPVEEPDASGGDDGGSDLSACEQACATAHEKGCPADTPCEICDFRSAAPNCDAAADPYLLCLAELDPETAYVCDENDKPQLVDDSCAEIFNEWIACVSMQ